MTAADNLIEDICKTQNLFTYDPYDIWNLKVGQQVKKIYYKNKWLGIFPAGILTIYDTYINNSKRFLYHKREYPIVHALWALTCLNLYEQKKELKYLNVADTSLQWLYTNYSKGYHGYCWGINMPWVSKNTCYKEDTPLISSTPYVLEAFIKYNVVTSSQKYKRVIESVYNFLEYDLRVMYNDKNGLALSYSPLIEHRIVINANAYALYCYALLFKYLPGKQHSIIQKMKSLFSFLKYTQALDGSWHYYADKKDGNFIDCFHSCFVLKNIFKANKIFAFENASEIIKKGYTYIKNNFWDHNYLLYKRFSESDKITLIRFDLYDNAEMLNLSCLLQDLTTAQTLKKSIQASFVVDDRIYSTIVWPHKRINKNFYRWAVMPYLYAHVISNNTF